jgi:hypothetical protein
MLNRFLGIDNCISCIHLRKLPNEIKCTRYNKIINKDCFSIPLKLEYCEMPFKYDSDDENNSDEEMCV